MNIPFKAVFIIALMVITSMTAMAIVSDDSDADTLYNVTLQGNGGSTSSGKTSVSYSVISGQGYPLSSSTFTRDGYILIGWSTSSGASAPAYHPGQYVTVNSNKTLYAVWEDLSYVGLIRLGDTAKGDTAEADVIITTSGVSPTLSLAGNGVYTIMQSLTGRTSYEYSLSVTHMGEAIASNTTTRGTTISADWLSLAISNSGTFTFSGAPVKEGVYTIDVTLRTKSIGGSYGDLDDLLIRWYVTVPVSGDDALSVSFDMDGGSGSLNTVTAPSGTAIILPSYTDSSGNQIQKSGYTLVGWEIPDNRGSRSVYALGSLYTIAYTTTATAKWVSDPNVLVYSLDGGTLANVQAYVISDGSTLTLRDTGVTKDGYTFLGWRPSQDHDIAYAPGLNIIVSGPMYMEAYFVPNSSQLYTATFDPNGGQGFVYSQRVESGMFVKLPTTVNMARDGYTFVGWSESRDGSLYGYEDYLVESNVTLYAVWEENSSPVIPDEPEPMPVYYDVSFSPNQGQGNYPVQRIMSGGYVTEPADPQREGYVFLGWKSLTDSDMWDFSRDTVTSDIRLQAQWAQHFTTSVDGLKVTVNMCGDYYDMAFDVWWGDEKGSSDAVGPSVGRAEHIYEYTTYGKITVRSHASSGTYESELTFSVAGEHYNPPVIYIVTFEPGNGDPSFEQNVGVGMTAEVPEDPVWEGHTFNGWYFEGVKWEFSDIITRNMTLVGGWDEIIPDTPPAVYPAAGFTISTTSTGWHLDSSRSLNALSYAWYLDGRSIGTGPTADIDSNGLTYGTHSVRLTVTSSTGHTDSETKQIVKQDNVPDQPQPTPGQTSEEDVNWLQENVWVVATVITLILILMVVRFWI